MHEQVQASRPCIIKSEDILFEQLQGQGRDILLAGLMCAYQG